MTVRHFRHDVEGAQLSYTRPASSAPWNLELHREREGRLSEHVTVELQLKRPPRFHLHATIRRWLGPPPTPEHECTLMRDSQEYLPPSLVSSLIREFGAFRDKQVLLTARPCDRAEVPQLISYLHDPRRTMPVLVVSPSDRGRILLDASWLAAKVAGLAHTYTLADERAAHAFGQEMGRELDCRGGAVRLYRPQLRGCDPGEWHTTWIPLELSEEGRRFSLMPLLELHIPTYGDGE